MSESIINFFSNIFSPELCTFIISMIPIVELRGAIPLAMLAWGMPWYEAFIISVVGNIIPIPFIIWFIRPVFNWLKRFKIFKKFVSWQERKVEKSSDKVMKNVKRGLFAFVAIPLPGTGAWTGSMIASFLNLDNKKAFLPIMLGVVTAGVIVTAICILINMGFSQLGWLVGR